MAILYEPPGKYNKIAIVGEAPGKEEERTGQPFVGASGRLLKRALTQAGIRWEHGFITNVIDIRPPKNNIQAISKEVIEKGKIALKKRLLRWDPNVIIAVGKTAMEALTDLGPITKVRGAVVPCTLLPGFKVIGTLHPANLLRGNMKMFPIFVADLAKAKRESKDKSINKPKRNFTILDDEISAITALQSVKPGIISVDIETAVTDKLTAFGWATSKTDGFSITKEVVVKPEVLKEISKFCKRTDLKKIFHNACYDVLWLAYYAKILTKGIYFDTMIAQHVCYPIWPKSLAFCASLYTDEVYFKDMGKSFFKLKDIEIRDWSKLYEYNTMDCMVTYEVYEHLNKELDELRLRKVFNFDMQMIEPVLFAMLHGVKIDKTVLEEIKTKNEKVISVLERLAKSCIGDVNVNSPKQLKELFYDKFGFTPIKNKGRITTDTKALHKMEALPTPYRPIIGLIRNMRDYYKRRTFYNIKTDFDGHVRTAYKITGTISGRLSSTKGLTGSGTNLQNIPKPMRKFFVPPPNHIFIQADLSQAEARLVAAFCEDEDWLHDFDMDDVHWKVAEFLFKKPRTELKKGIHRQMAKRVSHATHYMMSWNLLRELLHCDAKTAKNLIASYYAMRHKLKDWQDKTAWEVRKNREIRTPYGRRLIFPSTISDEDIRQAVSFRPQSCCGQYNNDAWLRQYRNMSYTRILLQVHDSLVHAVPDNIKVVKQALKDIKRLTEVPLRIGKIDLIIPVDFEIGYNWYDLKECALENVEEVYEQCKMNS